MKLLTALKVNATLVNIIARMGGMEIIAKNQCVLIQFASKTHQCLLPHCANSAPNMDNVLTVLVFVIKDILEKIAVLWIAKITVLETQENASLNLYRINVVAE